MGQAKNRGSRQQRVEQAMQRDQGAGSIEGLQRYLGFNRKRSEGDLPWDTPEDALACMVSNIVAANLGPVSQQSGLNFQIGEWFVSVGAHESTVVHGPFATTELAFEFARINFNTVRFVALDYE